MAFNNLSYQNQRFNVAVTETGTSTSANINKLTTGALNYDLFQGVEETTIDLYSSVRHFYLKRREQMIKE